MDREPEFDPDDDLMAEEIMARMIQEGELLGSCGECGTFLSPAEALSVCPHCQAQVWPDGLVVRLTSQLPQC